MMDKPLAKERMISEWYSVNFGAIRRTAAIVKSSDASLGAYFKEDAAITAGESAELLKQIEPMIDGGAEKALFEKIIAHASCTSRLRDAANKAKADGNAEEADSLLDKAYMPLANGYQACSTDGQPAAQRASTPPRAAIEATATRAEMIAILALCAVAAGRGVFLAADGRHHAADPRGGRGGRNGRRRRLVAAHRAAAKDETGALLRALRHMNDSLSASSAKCAAAPTPSPPPRAKSAPATSTCRAAPSSRPARWKKPPRRWKN